MRRRSGGGDGSAASRSIGAANRSTVADRSTSLMSRTEGPHRLRCCAIIALSPKIGVYAATASTGSSCDTSAATGLPMDTPDIAMAVDCDRSQRRSHLRHGAHHSRNVGQRVHVRIGRPCFATDTVARLHRQRDVETELALDTPSAGEQQIQRLSLSCAVHPYQPGPAVVAVSAQVHRCGRGPPEPLDRQRTRQHRIVLERQPVVHQRSEPSCRRIAFTCNGSGSA